MKKLTQLRDKLVRSGKDEDVRVALETLLLVPNNLDFQIDVLGTAHQANWLPKRKEVFWRAFPINSEQWITRCITRVLAGENDANALCALLNCEVLAVAPIVQTHSPHLVSVWDVNGSQSCGLDLAYYVDDQFDRYFYVGWKINCNVINRLDYIPRIEAPPGRGFQRLDKIIGQCEMLGSLWAELPHGFGCWSGLREFASPCADLEPQGCTETVRSCLGY